MSSHIRHHFPTYQIQCPVTFHITFRCTRFNVESYSIQLSAVQIQCRVTFHITFRCTECNVESHSTPHSTVPDPMSGHVQHHIPPYQIQCRVTFDNWKTEEALARAAVTQETERIKGSNPWCLWWWSHSVVPHPMSLTFDNVFYSVSCWFS